MDQGRLFLYYEFANPVQVRPANIAPTGLKRLNDRMQPHGMAVERAMIVSSCKSRSTTHIAVRLNHTHALRRYGLERKKLNRSDKAEDD